MLDCGNSADHMVKDINDLTDRQKTNVKDKELDKLVLLSEDEEDVQKSRRSSWTWGKKQSAGNACERNPCRLLYQNVDIMILVMKSKSSECVCVSK